MSNFMKVSSESAPRVELHEKLGLTGAEISINTIGAGESRSEERRVGKECRSRWSPYH